MRFPKTYTLENIAEIVGCTFVGAPDFPVLGMNEIHVVKEGEIVFVDHPKYYDKALNSNATIILINKDVDCPEGKALLISEDPFRDFNKLAVYFRPFQASSFNIPETSEVGEGTILQPNVFIGNHVKVGKNCIIHANVVINDYTTIGDDVVIHAGTVLGADAFYFKKRIDFFDPLISCGSVRIEDGVTLGALCTIDRGVTGDTIIKKGTKIDNQVHVGHDTVIGEMCLIAAQCGIAGCVIIEDHVTLWGQAGTTSGITIEKGAVISAKAGVSKSLKGNKVYFGVPAEEAREYYKHIAKIKNIVK